MSRLERETGLEELLCPDSKSGHESMSASANSSERIPMQDVDDIRTIGSSNIGTDDTNSTEGLSCDPDYKFGTFSID